MFTVIFAIPRTSGWVSQWMEMLDDSETEDRAAAPDLHRQARRGLRPVAEREGEEKITGPPAKRPKLPRRGA